MKDRTSKTELIAKSKHKNKVSHVIMISRDGWVVTDDGAFGDNEADCEIAWEKQITFLKNIRKTKKLSQKEMSWILGVSRPTYIAIEQGKREISHKQFLISGIINENF